MKNGKRFLALLAALCLLLCGCKQQPEPTVPTTETTVPTTAPTEPPQRTVPLHSGIREDGTFDEGTLFIGDSLTYGLLAQYMTNNDLLGDARYMAIPGASLWAFENGPRLGTDETWYSFHSSQFHGMLMSEAVAAAGESVTAIYLMMGTNHLDYVTDQMYVDVVSYMLEKCPNATIYMQQVPYSLSSLVDHEVINWRIWAAYNEFCESGETRVRLIHTQDAIELNVVADEVHLTEEGQRLWYEALVDYAETNGIPQ